MQIHTCQTWHFTGLCKQMDLVIGMGLTCERVPTVDMGHQASETMLKGFATQTFLLAGRKLVNGGGSSRRLQP